MRTTVLIIVVVFSLIFITDKSIATCIDVSSVSKYNFIDYRTILLYNGEIPVGIIELFPSETVSRGAKITYTKKIVCDLDKILIDGRPCEVLRAYRVD